MGKGNEIKNSGVGGEGAAGVKGDDVGDAE